MRLSDSIERFIKEMMEQEETEVELKRNELAEYFGCAPSQINYVLATRFSPDHGYVTESRRGGGGYIRIVRVCQQGSQELLYLVNERIGNELTETEACRLIIRLRDHGAVVCIDHHARQRTCGLFHEFHTCIVHGHFSAFPGL